MGTAGEGVLGGMNWEIWIDIYTLPCVNRELVGSCCMHRACSLVLCDGPEGWDGVGWWGRCKRKQVYIYI